MSGTDFLTHCEAISPYLTRGNRWTSKNIYIKSGLKSVKTCKNPNLLCKYPVVLYSKKRFCSRQPKNGANYILNVKLSGMLLSGDYCCYSNVCDI